MLAEKVETIDDYKQAMALGYSYFQGYFFCKPEIKFSRDIKVFKGSELRILDEINQDEPQFEKIANVIEKDVSLSYKMLKIVNSAALGIPNYIKSIRQALILIGFREVKKWVTLLLLRRTAINKPLELVRNSLIRARFCELISELLKLKKRSSELFLLGLFSRVDALLDCPMDEVLKELPMSMDLKEALQNKENSLAPLLAILNAFEQAKWGEVDLLAEKMNLLSQEIGVLFFEAEQWTDEFFNVL